MPKTALPALLSLSLLLAGCGSSERVTTQVPRTQAPATTPHATAQESAERQYDDVLAACLSEGDSRAECTEYVHGCRAVGERPSSCRENHVGRAKERAKETEHAREAQSAELETVHHEVEGITAHERERRLIREQEEAAAQVCGNSFSPGRCERAEEEAHSRIKSIEEEG
jgi:hypothetical protein